MTGENAGQVLSCEIKTSGVPTPFMEAEGHIEGGATREPASDPAQSETLCMRRSSSPGNREIPEVPATANVAGRPGKATSQKPGVDASGKSDGCVVPGKPPNKGGAEAPSAEGAEGRQPTKGNACQTAASRTQSRERASIGLARVREAARRDRRALFTALLHHVTFDQLRTSFYALKRAAAPGVDGVTWEELKERSLELTVWDYDRLTSNDFLGGVRLNTGLGKSSINQSINQYN